MNVDEGSHPSGTVVIDLGEEWSAPPDRDRPTPRISRHRVSARPWVLAVFAVLLVLSSTAAAPHYAPVRLLAAVLTNPAVTAAAGRDTVFVLDHSETHTDPGTLTAYTLPGGRPRWRVTTPYAHSLWPVPSAGVLIILNEDSTVSSYDAHTGTLLWHERFRDMTISKDGRALLLYAEASGQLVVSRRDPRTGKPSWIREFPPMTGLAVDYSARRSEMARLVLLGPDGMVTVLDERTGATATSRRITDAIPAGPDDEFWLQVIVIGDQMYVMRKASGAPGTMAAYRLDTLTRRWRITDVAGHPRPCGEVLCLYGNGGLVGVDPHTGAVRWRAPQWGGVFQAVDDRIIVGSEGFNGAPRVAVIDASSGSFLLGLTGWGVIKNVGQSTARPLLPLDTGGQPMPALFGSVLGSTADQMRLATLVPGPAAVRPIGALPGADMAENCTVTGRLIVCVTTEPGVRVWRYRGAG